MYKWITTSLTNLNLHKFHMTTHLLKLTTIITALILTQSWELSMVVLPILMVYTTTYIYSPISSPIPVSPSMSLDSMSTMLIMLTLWITSLMVMTSTKIKFLKLNPNLFITSTLILCLILMIGFSMNTMLSFYIFFEASLIPTLIIILTWGYQPERLEAGMHLMLYTITASLPLLMAIINLHHKTNSTMFFYPMHSESLPIYMNITLLTAFLIKMPMYLTHMWLPKAHVEAPAAGSMILASILLKLGSYGMLRMAMLHPSCVTTMSPMVLPVSMWGAVLTTILCIRQTDMKSMIAYSSISHMAMVIAGISSMSKWGWEGAFTMMMAHGLVSSGLFALTNMYYENTMSRSLLINNGLLILSPSMTLWWFTMIAANMAAPPTINLLSEIIIISSTITYSGMIAPLLFLITLFTVTYSMILYTSLHHGPPKTGMNFIKIIPLYYTVSALHVIPTGLLTLASNQLTSWT